ncbi:MAG TPA: nucleotidyl transferase AbiEii/AbiGii toxin family protein [Actinospica sp.]|nr:nucleotidyl transferase AbiEii/AbiGii toxin family protein [Actinospica sp.]
MNEPRIRAAHRAALDHVLGLVLELPWSGSLVLRGSRLLRAWLGDRAREPGDLDFVVLPNLAIPVDELDPHPYVAGHHVVQQWPEFADGAGRYRIWHDGEGEHDTRGVRALVPPEGLSWEFEPRETSVAALCEDLRELVRRNPRAAPGVRLDAEGFRLDGDWAYSYDAEGDGPGGIRVLIPWRLRGRPGGEVQLDLASDERLPEPPVWTLIPRANGAEPLPVQAVSRELSLAWKLKWLRLDAAGEDGPRLKDLYDAMLLAGIEP